VIGGGPIHSIQQGWQALPHATDTGGIFRNRRISNQRLQKKYFKTHDKLTYEDGWTEHEAALNNNLYRMYDAGKIRWMRQVK